MPTLSWHILIYLNMTLKKYQHFPDRSWFISLWNIRSCQMKQNKRMKLKLCRPFWQYSHHPIYVKDDIAAWKIRREKLPEKKERTKEWTMSWTSSWSMSLFGKEEKGGGEVDKRKMKESSSSSLSILLLNCVILLLLLFVTAIFKLCLGKKWQGGFELCKKWKNGRVYFFFKKEKIS